MTNEQWKTIAGWVGYEVSDAGRVRKVDGTILTQWLNADGYSLVRLSNPRRVERVHRLVATAFVPNQRELPFVNHIDNARSNNSRENLEWCTQQENLSHAERQGRMQRDYWVGKRSPNASLSDEDVSAIRRTYGDGKSSHSALAAKYGISKRAIGRLLNRETYSDV